jgi:serine/threonine protein kinase
VSDSDSQQPANQRGERRDMAGLGTLLLSPDPASHHSHASHASDGEHTPECAVQCTAHRDDNNAWRRFLEQLRSRGPVHTRYERRDEVGRGGMGVVYRVFDKDAQRELAMKIIAECDDDATKCEIGVIDDRTLGRFLEEAQVTSQLDHPSVVPIHEIGLDALGRVYFTMKLVKGEDLKTIFDKLRSGVDGWTLHRVVSALIRVCEAMAYAHAKGVLHRDLKPSNVMIGRFGEVYVMDWGLALLLDAARGGGGGDETDAERSTVRSSRRDQSRTGSSDELLTLDGDVVGTPAYMAPEQARGDRDLLSPRADVYALGAILYHLLSGHSPYRHESDGAAPSVLALVAARPPLPLREVAKGAPPELIAIAEKAMARRIDDRYTSMIELGEDLRAFLENRVVSAYCHGPVARALKWSRRNRGVIATAVVALLALSTLTGFHFDSLREREMQARREAANAENARARLARLADSKRLEMLLAEYASLPAAGPDRERWLGRARDLLSRRAEHAATLAMLRAGRSRIVAQDGTTLGYDFGSDDESRWWHDTLEELVAGLDALAAR